VAAVLLLTGCAAQKAQHSTVEPTKTNAATASKPRVANHPGPSPAAVRKNVAPSDAGYYLDVLHGRLQQVLDPAVIVGRDGSRIVLDFSRRFGFVAASAQLDDVDRRLLAPLVNVLGEYQSVAVSVRVNTDDDAARELAQQRASAIAQVMTDGGIGAARIKTLVSEAAARDGGAHVEVVLTPEVRTD
jgi:outer membrane protein OmpA-like peptidoglycan-associated protein